MDEKGEPFEKVPRGVVDGLTLPTSLHLRLDSLTAEKSLLEVDFGHILRMASGYLKECFLPMLIEGIFKWLNSYRILRFSVDTCGHPFLLYTIPICCAFR